MDRKTYGADEEWVIYNGKGENEFQSLLTQYLGVKKIEGILVENQITSLTSGEDIDTSNTAKVKFNFDAYNKTDDYKNYAVADVANGTVISTNDEVFDLIGMDVNAFVKETNRANEYEIISIAASTKNKTKEFTLDLYDELASTGVKFFKNKDARTSDTIKLVSNVPVLFNSVYYNYTDLDVEHLIITVQQMHWLKRTHLGQVRLHLSTTVVHQTMM